MHSIVKRADELLWRARRSRSTRGQGRTPRGGTRLRASADQRDDALVFVVGEQVEGHDAGFADGEERRTIRARGPAVDPADDGQQALKVFLVARRHRLAARPEVERATAQVTPETLENLVTILDDAVEQERISRKTAKNIWGEVTAAFNQACRSKRRDLRVRQDNPTTNVPGPDRGQQRQQPILYPDEVVALLSSEKVPIHWRVLYAVAIYTGARAGELAALSASDVDLPHRRLTIARQRDRLTGELRLTKTKLTRAFDIEEALYPLVERLVGARPTGDLVRLPILIRQVLRGVTSRGSRIRPRGSTPEAATRPATRGSWRPRDSAQRRGQRTG